MKEGDPPSRDNFSPCKHFVPRRRDRPEARFHDFVASYPIKFSSKDISFKRRSNKMILADDKTETTLGIADIMAATAVRLRSAILNVSFSLVPL